MTWAKMPELTLKGYWDGSLASGIDAFYSDSFPFRDALISLGSTLEEMRGLRLDDAKIHVSSPLHFGAGSPHQSRAAAQKLEISSSSEAEETAVGRTEWLRYSSIRGCADTPMCRRQPVHGQVVCRCHQFLCGGCCAGMCQVYDIVVPTSIEFYLPEKYQDISAPEKPNIRLYLLPDERCGQDSGCLWQR